MKITIATVESFTGGFLSASFVAKKGASKFFKGSLVTYDTEIKKKIGIDISQGVVNESTARAMALWGKQYFNVDVCIATTGNAGPEAMENKKVGEVFIAFNENVHHLQFYGSRTAIIKKVIKFIQSILHKEFNFEN